VQIPSLPDRIRVATPADVPTIRRLIAELAAYEREPDAARATEDQLRKALFDEQPAVYALIAEQVPGEPVGFALYFRSFSTWEGVHGIYLEDLFVLPEHRGSGLGRDLLVALARIAVHNGYARFEWWVLDWNTPSIDFYRALGAVAQDEWTTFRVTGDALTALATRGS
jgi:GNAT superfamily N-acetyltransferase